MGDVFDRLEKLVKEKEKLLPRAAPMKQAEHLELERSDAKASVMASGRDGSDEG
jgi:hypothetical protein